MTGRSRAARAGFVCSECGHQAAQWVGRCPSCQAWGTLAQQSVPTARTQRVAAGAPSAPARRIADVELDTARARPTGVEELDRVLGGGLVPGAVVLLAGEPGVGKSTLLLEVAAKAAQRGRVLYVTGEESAGQVRLRAERTGGVHDELYLAAESDLGAILGHLDALKPGLLIVDSIQTMSTSDVEGNVGGVTQVRAVTVGLTATAKERGLPVVLVGHVTKDGSIAGPRVLEHLVDVVLAFEGDKQSTLRMVRGVKNRFGPADEVGCFELRDEGIVGLPDPSGLFLARFGATRDSVVPGTAVTVVMDGRRPMLAEVQALVAGSNIPSPRRAVSGLDSARVAMLLAVLERRVGVKLADSEVYTATVGGMKVLEPAADLALALAVVSAKRDLALPPDMILLGEIGLAGEVRRVSGVGRRLAEAARLGFTQALVPPDSDAKSVGMKVQEVADLGQVVRRLRRD
ncbi:MAG: DNA repair protein RadA [Pseudonocardia sp.]|uniref:DNA repair protein RadA n=1 Tax=unclassified Pseudonocardia TaxID=2619320 RepID=UPI00086CE703|nr:MULTISPECIES: DNA repair protein RadA [unclassified Pseudonocardia]MBN9113203.1 DNA repair protein RadA [Pseudonocardia sp.]ODV01771.1 MAG: DNA repair protein RadA [Pseudonocardia sp. SCN 73-27]